MVATGDQVGPAKLVLASTTIGTFVAQEMIKPKPLDAAAIPELLFRITGAGSNHSAVGQPPKDAPQPMVPGR